MQNIDLNLFYTLNHLAGHNGLLDMLMIGLAKWGIFFYGAILVYLYLSKNGSALSKTESVLNKEIAIRCFIAGCLALVLNLVIGLFYFRPRPFMAHKVNLLIAHPPDSSFPSDHAAGSAGMSFGMLSLKPKLGRVMTGFSLLMVIARVYVGVHYPLDVIAGMAVGFLGCLGERVLWARYQPIADWLIGCWDGFYAKMASFVG